MRTASAMGQELVVALNACKENLGQPNERLVLGSRLWWKTS